MKLEKRLTAPFKQTQQIIGEEQKLQQEIQAGGNVFSNQIWLKKKFLHPRREEGVGPKTYYEKT